MRSVAYPSQFPAVRSGASAAAWAVLGSVVTLLLLAAALFPLQAVAVGTSAIALAELARLYSHH